MKYKYEVLDRLGVVQSGIAESLTEFCDNYAYTPVADWVGGGYVRASLTKHHYGVRWTAIPSLESDPASGPDAQKEVV